MQETSGHLSNNPGLRGHSSDPSQDLLKKFVVVHELETGGHLWEASFNNRMDALGYLDKKFPGQYVPSYKIIDQFNNNQIVWRG